MRPACQRRRVSGAAELASKHSRPMPPPASRPNGWFAPPGRGALQQAGIAPEPVGAAMSGIVRLLSGRPTSPGSMMRTKEVGMTKRQMQHYEMLVRVQEFGTRHRARFPDASVG